MLQTKKGWGWNDEHKEIKVTEKDLYNINIFMAPIEEELRSKDLARESFLNGERLKKTRRLEGNKS